MKRNIHKEMHICLKEDLKKRFHMACVMQGKKMTQLVIELIEQWLETNEDYGLEGKGGQKMTTDR